MNTCNLKILMSLGVFYPSQIGGPGNSLYWLGKEFVNQGIKTTAIVSDHGVADDFAPRNQWFDLNGIKIKYCETKSMMNLSKLTWLTIKEVPTNDVIMLSSLFYKPNFFVGLTALLYDKRILWSPRGELLVSRGKIKRVYLKVVKYLFGSKVIFHATSIEEEASVYKFMGDKAKCIVVPNYMELPCRVESNMDEKYLLYVGRIMPIKALEKLIEGISMSKLFVKNEYRLYLAGRNDGKYYFKLLALIKELHLEDHIVFKGMVEGNNKEILYAKAKATLLVSHTENFGNVIIESLAQGTPAITSKGTPWKILRQTGTGYWIDNSPETIGKTIDELIHMNELDYSLMREKAYKLCCDNFDVKLNVDKWLKILKSDV